ncbi:MAG TPA: hypothetical protein VHK69_14830, partial [Chitinophagaceae bacterium]|nr:hypothetical protein [Chitinophagaceae bacterium]
MSRQYNQVKAMLAIMNASLRATFRSPQNVFFSLFFPIVLIVIFGSLSGRGMTSVEVGLDPRSDTANILYFALKSADVLHFVQDPDRPIEEELEKGRITAILSILPAKGGAGQGPYVLEVRSSSASQRNLSLLQMVVTNVLNEIDRRLEPGRTTYATVRNTLVPGRRYKLID